MGCKSTKSASLVAHCVQSHSMLCMHKHVNFIRVISLMHNFNITVYVSLMQYSAHSIDAISLAAALIDSFKLNSSSCQHAYFNDSLISGCVIDKTSSMLNSTFMRAYVSLIGAVDGAKDNSNSNSYSHYQTSKYSHSSQSADAIVNTIRALSQAQNVHVRFFAKVPSHFQTSTITNVYVRQVVREDRADGLNFQSFLPSFNISDFPTIVFHVNSTWIVAT